MKKSIKIITIIIVLIILLFQIPIVRGVVEIVFLNSFETTKFVQVQNTLYMEGIINGKTPGQLEALFAENPNISEIVMLEVEGSVNDEANLRAAKFVADRDVNTRIFRYGLIASGGTDFFLAGDKRFVEDGAKIGVHSWGGSGGEVAKDFPVGHEAHQPYIDYYQAVGFTKEASEKFYYFTINAASASDIYFMTNDEIVAFALSNTGITTPQIIVPGAEEIRKQAGDSYISNEEAERRGIPIQEE